MPPVLTYVKKSDEGQIGLRARTTLDESPEVMRQVQLAIARAKEGDRDALRLLYVRYSENVYGYVRSIVRDEKEAEDLTQHVFLKLMSAICKYDDRGVPFSAWLLRLARNAALDHLRRRRAIPAEEVYGADTQVDDDSLDRARSLRAALDTLPERAAQRRRHAPRDRSHAAGDRRPDGPLGELDPRPAPPWPQGAAAGAAAPGLRALDRLRGRLSVMSSAIAAPQPPHRSRAHAVPFTRMDNADPELLEELLGTVREVAERGAFTLGQPRRGLRAGLRHLLRDGLRDRRVLGHRGARARAARAGDRTGRRGDRAGQLVHRHGRGGQRRGRDAARSWTSIPTRI